MIEVLGILVELMFEGVVCFVDLVFFKWAQQEIVWVAGLFAGYSADRCDLLTQLYNRLKQQHLMRPMRTNTINQSLQFRPGYNMRGIDNSKG